jgi:hypothetical protein
LELLESCLGDFTWTKENREILALQIDWPNHPIQQLILPSL